MRDKRFDPGLLVAAALALIAAWPFLARPGLPQFTDAEMHVYRAGEVLASLRAGVLWPRWAPDFYYGYGYPYYTGYQDAYPSGSGVYYYSGSAYAPVRSLVTLPSNSARLQVLLPNPDAQVWIEGSETSTRGMTRVFESPELTAGRSYTYTVRAAWQKSQRTVTEERKVTVAAGRSSVVDFTRPPEPEKVAAPR